MSSILQQIKAINTKVDTLEFGSDVTAISTSIQDLQNQVTSNTNLISNIESSPLIENGLSVTSSYSLVFNKKLSKSSIPGANDIANDSEGNIYVISDDNVIKFDKNTGEVIWIVENIHAGEGEAILVDKDDNIICVGAGYIDNQNNPTVQDETAEGFVFNGGNKDIIIHKMDTDGNEIMRLSGGNLAIGSSDDEMYIHADTFGDDFYIVGETNSPDFGSFLIGEGNEDAIFIVKKGISDSYNRDLKWVRRIGSTAAGFEEGRYALVKCDLEGNIFVTGRIDDTTIGTMITGEIAEANGSIIAKVSSNGDLIWIGRLNGYTIGIDVDLGNNVVISYEHNSSNLNKVIKISSSGTYVWEKSVQSSYARYYRELGTSLRINKNNGDICLAGKGNLIRLDTFGNEIENISIGNTDLSYISIYNNTIYIATSSSDQSFGDILSQSDTTSGTRTNILSYDFTENIEKYSTDKVLTLSQYPQNLDDVANKKYVDREIYNKISSQSVLDKNERDGLYSYVNNLQSIVKMNFYPWSFWVANMGYDPNNTYWTWTSSYNWAVSHVGANSTVDVFKIRYTPIGLNNYVKVDFDFDWSWDRTQDYKTTMWKREYGSSDTLTRLNKICSEFGEQSGRLKGIFQIDSLNEQEIIITIQNYSNSEVNQGGVNPLDYSIVAQVLEYKPEIVSSEYTNIQISSIENLQTILDGKQNIVQSYPISSITDLQTNLDSLTTNINTNTNNITSNLNLLNSLTSSLSSIQTQQEINTNDIVSLNADKLSDKIFFGTKSTDIILSSLQSFYYSTFDNVVLTNNQIYSQTNDSTITVLKAGVYKVEFCSTFFNNSYDDRIVMGSIVEINDINNRATGGLATCYLRHSSYGRHGTTTNSLIFNLNVNDRIRVFNGGNKTTATGFSSELSGIRFVTGSNILITYLS